MTLSAHRNSASFPSHQKQLRGGLLNRAVRAALPLLHRASANVNADVPVLEAALGLVDPTLSLRHVRAKVVEVRDETHDVKTFVLRPNARFGTFRPGSFVTLQLTIEGQPVQRSYSLSSAPTDPRFVAITVKRVPGGKVSNWLADTVRVGQVLTLSAPQGQFVLPLEVPKKLLLLSAGSGITPVMSMLRELVAQGSRSEIHFVHFARSPHDVIFASELAAIVQHNPNVHLTVCVEEASASFDGPRGRFSEAVIADAVPEFREMETFLCGPPGFMKVVMQTLEKSRADLSKLRYERFNVEFDVAQFLTEAQVLRFVRTGSESISAKPRTILEEAESLGVRIESGCRAGNCGTCRCTKKSGIVVDVVTGRESHAGEELIYPCITVAKGTVEIEL